MTVAAALCAPAAIAQPEPTTSPNAGLGVRLLEAPVSLKDDPRAASYIIDNLPPGTQISRKIEVSNNTGAPQSVSLYSGAASIDSTGFAFQDGATVNELTSWTTVEPPTMELADGTTGVAVATITVPKDAAEAERYGVVWAQVSSAGPEGGSGAATVSRVGIRMYLSVGPGNGPPADFTVSSVTPRRNDSGAPELVADITNSGGRAVDISGELTLSGGPGGLGVGPVASAGLTLAPGQNGQAVFTLDPQLPNGPWSAAATLKSGLISKDSTASITFPDAGAGQSISTDGGGSSTPWIWIVLAVVVVLAVAAALVVRQRRRTSAP